MYGVRKNRRRPTWYLGTLHKLTVNAHNCELFEWLYQVYSRPCFFVLFFALRVSLFYSISMTFWIFVCYDIVLQYIYIVYEHCFWCFVLSCCTTLSYTLDTTLVRRLWASSPRINVEYLQYSSLLHAYNLAAFAHLFCRMHLNLPWKRYARGYYPPPLYAVSSAQSGCSTEDARRVASEREHRLNKVCTGFVWWGSSQHKGRKLPSFYFGDTFPCEYRWASVIL